LGSCAFYFQWTEIEYPNDFPTDKKEWKYLYFSGDIGSVSDNIPANIMFKGHQTPYWDNCDKCIVMESTYGGRVRQKDDLFRRKINKLSEILNEAASKEGVILIPAFALDRSQQILLDLYYIFKNTPSDAQSEDIESMDWLDILVFLCKDIYPDRLHLKIETLQCEDKKTRSVRNKLRGEIVSMCKENNIVPDKNNFGVLRNDLQEAIASLFDKYNIKKPINIIQEAKREPNFTFDSPLVEKVNEVYLKHLTDEAFSVKDDKRKFKYLSDSFLKEFGIAGGNLHEQKNEIQTLLSRFLKNSRRVKIIVSAAGMCDEGRVLELLEKYLPDEKATVILTGFQAKGTNGLSLKNLSNGKYDENNEKEKIPLKLRNSDLRLADVKCAIKDMSEYYSGHADQEQLIDYITPDERNTGNITVLLNHGTNEAREELKGKIEERRSGTKVLLPEFNQWLNIATLEYEPEDIEFEKNVQFAFVKVADIHLYYPIGYDGEKLQSIIDYIGEL
jgi:Cft2 family RNA processing exonuclease